MIRLVLWIIPVTSLIVCCSIYANAVGITVDIGFVANGISFPYRYKNREIKKLLFLPEKGKNRSFFKQETSLNFLIKNSPGLDSFFKQEKGISDRNQNQRCDREK